MACDFVWQLPVTHACALSFSSACMFCRTAAGAARSDWTWVGRKIIVEDHCLDIRWPSSHPMTTWVMKNDIHSTCVAFLSFSEYHLRLIFSKHIGVCRSCFVGLCAWEMVHLNGYQQVMKMMCVAQLPLFSIYRGWFLKQDIGTCSIWALNSTCFDENSVCFTCVAFSRSWYVKVDFFQGF